MNALFSFPPFNEEKNIETWKNANKKIMIQKISELLKIIDILICIYVYLTSTSHISFFEKKIKSKIETRQIYLKLDSHKQKRHFSPSNFLLLSSPSLHHHEISIKQI